MRLDSVRDPADPPSGPSGAGSLSSSSLVEDDHVVGDAEHVPRVLKWAVVKRIDPRLPNTWGHWWIEFGDESYGWWPTPCPMGWKGALLGSRGVLNGIGTTNGGTATRDAYHGDEPDHWFHPTLVASKSDDQVRAEIRAFAQRYVGGFRWQWWWLREPAENCRTFQDEMFETVGLFEEPEYLYTRGSGCPFMFPFRRVKWTIIDGVAMALARVRGWSPTPRWRRGERTLSAQRHPEASAPMLTDPKARALARIRGTLFVGRDQVRPHVTIRPPDYPGAARERESEQRDAEVTATRQAEGQPHPDRGSR
jgi:hypothetical protein